MSNPLKLLFVLIIAQTPLIGAQARDSYEATLMLREALMQSNADYNKLKKNSNDAEFERDSSWNNRKVKSIVIGDEHILKESRLNEYKELNEEMTRRERDISSHNE